MQRRSVGEARDSQIADLVGVVEEKIPLAVGVAAVVSVIKLALNVVLIFGLFGFPRLELVGAGLATVFAQLVGVALHVGQRGTLLVGTQAEYGSVEIRRRFFAVFYADATNGITEFVA